MAAGFEVGDIIMNNLGQKKTIKSRKPFNTPPAPPGEEPNSEDDVLAGYGYTLNDGSVIHILIFSNTDEHGKTWSKDSVAQGIKRRKSNKKSRKTNKRGRKSNKKRRNYRK